MRHAYPTWTHQTHCIRLRFRQKRLNNMGQTDDHCVCKMPALAQEQHFRACCNTEEVGWPGQQLFERRHLSSKSNNKGHNSNYSNKNEQLPGELNELNMLNLPLVRKE